MNLKRKAFTSLKCYDFLKKSEKHKFSTAEKFHEFTLKRKILKGFYKIYDTFSLPKTIE